MSFALLRPGVVRFCALSFAQPRCGMQLKAKGIQYYWPDYPYEKLHAYPSLFDRPQYRLNDNSRSIAVEGNIAVGKGLFAKNLAEVLHLKYVPDVTDDDIFIDKNYEPGIDYREFNKVLPKDLQFYTTEMLYRDPDPIHHGRPLYIQQNYYMYRCLKWWKACGHLFHTGQGFVTPRSPFASYAIAKAMAECGLLSADARDWLIYYDRHVTSAMLLPHLVVYLRSPVQLSRANLDKRGIPWESRISDKFLEVVKQVYETEFLPKVSRFSEVYTVDVEDYDFSDHNDVTFIAEQLCKIDLDQRHLSTDIDTKLLQWRMAMFNGDTKQSARVEYSTVEPIFQRLVRIQPPDDMSEGGLTIAQAAKLRKEFLSRDPRFTEWSVLKPWDAKSAMDVLLGRTRFDDTTTSYWYDEDVLKVMAYYRSFGYYSRSVQPELRMD